MSIKVFGTVALGLLVSGGVFAASAPDACILKAKENVEAVSRIMYAPKGLARIETQVLSSEKKDEFSSLVTIETYDSSDEPLHCIYRAEMLSNVTGDCWLVGLTQTECSQ